MLRHPAQRAAFESTAIADRPIALVAIQTSLSPPHLRQGGEADALTKMASKLDPREQVLNRDQIAVSFEESAASQLLKLAPLPRPLAMRCSQRFGEAKDRHAGQVHHAD